MTGSAYFKFESDLFSIIDCKDKALVMSVDD